MIEQALHVLTLHIIWKSKGLTVDNDPTPEEVRYKETLVEERDTLLEKLVEYAVGTQSNTVEGVKRAVRFPSPSFIPNLNDIAAMTGLQTPPRPTRPLFRCSIPRCGWLAFTTCFCGSFAG